MIIKNIITNGLTSLIKKADSEGVKGQAHRPDIKRKRGSFFIVVGAKEKREGAKTGL